VLTVSPRLLEINQNVNADASPVFQGGPMDVNLNVAIRRSRDSIAAPTDMGVRQRAEPATSATTLFLVPADDPGCDADADQHVEIGLRLRDGRYDVVRVVAAAGLARRGPAEVIVPVAREQPEGMDGLHSEAEQNREDDLFHIVLP
jgi:hypothetical protein